MQRSDLCCEMVPHKTARTQRLFEERGGMKQANTHHCRAMSDLSTAHKQTPTRRSQGVHEQRTWTSGTRAHQTFTDDRSRTELLSSRTPLWGRYESYGDATRISKERTISRTPVKTYCYQHRFRSLPGAGKGLPALRRPPVRARCHRAGRWEIRETPFNT